MRQKISICTCSAKQNISFYLGIDRSLLWSLIVNKRGPPFEIFLFHKINICFGQNFVGHNELHFLYLTNVQGATIGIRRGRIYANFYWPMHVFQAVYFGSYTHFFSMIRVSWDTIRESVTKHIPII